MLNFKLFLLALLVSTPGICDEHKLESLPKDAELIAGPTLIHVKKTKSELDYRICSYDFSSAVSGKSQKYMVTCRSLNDEKCPDIKECVENSIKENIDSQDAVRNPKESKDNDRLELTGKTCVYDGPNAAEVVLNSDPKDALCVTRMACTNTADEVEKTHIACDAVPGRVKVKGRTREFSVCPRIKSCHENKFPSKNLGKHGSIVSSPTGIASSSGNGRGRSH